MSKCKFNIFIIGSLFVFLSLSLLANDSSNKVVTNLIKAYEIWKDKGIVLVVKDENGQIITNAKGKLESWGGESKWVVRDSKGRFLLHAFGRVENWKNGLKKLVLRTPKGHLLTHIRIELTSNASFAENVVHLRRLKDSKFLSFVQETLAERLINDIKKGDLIKAKVLVKYLDKYYYYDGIKNFEPVLKMIEPHLKFLVTHNNDQNAAELLKKINEVKPILGNKPQTSVNKEK